MRSNVQARESAASSPAPALPALPAARGWGGVAPGAPAGDGAGVMLPGVAAAPVQRSATGGEVIQRGRKDKDRGAGGGGGGKRQGRKSQRDKKHGLMNDPVHGQDFIQSLHAEKQKSGRRLDFSKDEVREREAEFLASKGLRPVEVPPQPDRFSGLPDTDSDEDDSGEELLSEHPEKNPTKPRKDDKDDEDDQGGGPRGGLSGQQRVTVS